ncbi:MAG: metallophosphoesterase [candidate division KSB1 bacterium]|nr:metallophosphoesterase [candidate division KSB1 bacterium]
MSKKTVLTVFSLLLFANSLTGKTITLLHTNDMHAQYLPMQAVWIQKSPKPLIGGLVALDYHIRRQQNLYPNSLLLDAGDICTGTPLSNIEYKGAKNGAFVHMMNLMGYDALTIGNHEFDEGQENLGNLIELADFDVLACNLYKNDRIVCFKAVRRLSHERRTCRGDWCPVEGSGRSGCYQKFRGAGAEIAGPVGSDHY